MKKIFFTVILSIPFFTIQAQTYSALIDKANEMYDAKEFQKSTQFYTQAFAVEKKDASDLYNGACSAALANNNKKAFQFLNFSIQKGYKDVNHLKTDTDLDNLHNTKKWKSIVLKLEKKVVEMDARYDKPLQKELLEIYEDDQNIRNLYVEAQKENNYQTNKVTDSLGKIMTENDKVNLIKVTKILDQKGWVGEDIVGPKANSTLFLVIQHSDLVTQKKYVPMMKAAVKKGNASPSSLALLVDRIEIREGRKQIYGSQIGTNSLTKTNYVLPLLDPDNVDKRRAIVGLDSIAEYIKYWNLTWDVEKYKTELSELEKINR